MLDNLIVERFREGHGNKELKKYLWGFNNAGPSRNQNGGEPQQGPGSIRTGTVAARPQNPIWKQTPIGEIKCWTCGKAGHYASDCKTNGPKFAFAPKVIRMNYIQEILDQENDYSEGEQNLSAGNELILV